MGGGTRSKTVQEAQVPGYVDPLAQQSAQRATELQSKATLDEFLKAAPLRIAGLSEKEKQAGQRLGDLTELAKRRVTGANIQSSPSYQAARQAYQTAINPTVENTAVLGGLNRSTALGNAQAAAEAQYLQPTIEAELAREQAGYQQEAQLTLAQIQGLTGLGGTERGIEQAAYEAEQQDAARRQAIAETALFQPLGQIVPSTIGQTSSTRGKQGVFTA